MKDLFNNRLIIIAGHYGVGKTNFSVNLAKKLMGLYSESEECPDNNHDEGLISIVDLDIVNPYFRSSDKMESLKKEGIRVISPAFAATTLENPSISPQVQVELSGRKDNAITIVDTGGDPEGIRVLARYREDILSQDFKMLYVINKYRPEISSVEGSIGILKEIEEVSGLKATHIVNNSHLKSETNLKVILDSMSYAQEVSDAANLPLALICVPKTLTEEEIETLKTQYSLKESEIFRISNHMTTPWEVEDAEI